MKDKLNKGQQLFGIAVKEPVIPDSSEAPWKNMPQDKPEELFALKCSKARLSCFAFRVPEGHLSVLMGDDIPFTDHTPVQIPGPDTGTGTSGR